MGAGNKETNMSTWMLNILALDGVASPPDESIQPTVPQLRRDLEKWRARAFLLERQKEALSRDMGDRLDRLTEAYEGKLAEANAALEAEVKKNEQARQLNGQLEKKLEETKLLLESLQKRKGQPLRYDDLYEGGVLSENVGAFTFFSPTVEQNNAFLELLNYADRS